MGIRISKKHGVNPSVEKCFWCGESMGVVLFGALKGDAEAPREVVVSYEPCEKCKEIFAQGCQCIEVNDSPTDRGRIPIQKKGDQELYPTGRYHVLKHEVAARIFGDNGVTEETEVLFIDNGVFDWIQKQYALAMKPVKRRRLGKKPTTWPVTRKDDNSV